MNCSICGNPLLSNRVVFHCSCGAFVHAHCWDKHVVQAHKPDFELGTINLNDEFEVSESKVKVEEVEVEKEDSSGQIVTSTEG